MTFKGGFGARVQSSRHVPHHEFSALLPSQRAAHVALESPSL
jgi:hypothetical protein